MGEGAETPDAMFFWSQCVEEFPYGGFFVDAKGRFFPPRGRCCSEWHNSHRMLNWLQFGSGLSRAAIVVLSCAGMSDSDSCVREKREEGTRQQSSHGYATGNRGLRGGPSMGWARAEPHDGLDFETGAKPSVNCCVKAMKLWVWPQNRCEVITVDSRTDIQTKQ